MDWTKHFKKKKTKPIYKSTKSQSTIPSQHIALLQHDPPHLHQNNPFMQPQYVP